MLLVLLSLLILLFSALLAALSNHHPARARFFGVSGAILGSVCGLVPVISNLFDPATVFYSMPWSVPMGSFTLRLDPLSALFLLAVHILSFAAAIYGAGYLKPEGGKPTGLAWAAFNILSGAMAMVFLSANAVLFMLSWEIMAVSSFFLVAYDHEKTQVRKAAYIYLVAGAAGALALLMAFSLLAPAAGALDFAGFVRPSGHLASAAFLCALLGFGLKAGIIPLHVWLPEAHPAAPSHVSAVMSGVMIKTGIYGLIRMLGFLAPWPHWWGHLLILLGAVSAILGVIFALSQHDIKRLLAYSSVENIGIIVMALGLGVTGVNAGMPALAAFAFAGALLHALNHALFKGLLFMGAGSVIHATGTGELEALGGLAKKMPRTALLFALGAAAISALPPFNGFVSEFCIYLGSFKALSGPPEAAFWAIIVIFSLSVVGALAAACFTKAFGGMFLGEPRHRCVELAHEPCAAMLAGMAIPALGCLAIGVFSPFLMYPLTSAVSAAFDAPEALVSLGGEFFYGSNLPLFYISAAALALTALIILAAALRAYLTRKALPATSGTWDCGYSAPTARMQYGPSSFSQPLTSFFQPLLKSHHRFSEPEGFFPQGAGFQTESRALFYNHLYTPAAEQLRKLAYRFSWLQHGRLQLYILYIVAALMALLLWKL